MTSVSENQDCVHKNEQQWGAELSCSELVLQTLSLWRLASTRQLHALLHTHCDQREELLKRSLNRLRRRGLIRSFKLGREFLNFSLEEEFRFQRLLKENPENRQSYFSRSGIKHHLECLDLYLLLTEHLPNLKIFSNPLSSIEFHSKANGNYGVIRCAPDLALMGSWKEQPRMIYVEYEKNQKAHRRYEEKWEAYELDELVDRVLYVAESEILFHRLNQMLRQYFRRSYSFDNFAIGVTTWEHIEKEFLRAPCQVFGAGETKSIQLCDVLTQKEIVTREDKS